MTKEEATKILAILKAAYPNSYRGVTEDEALGTVGVWYVQFANTHYAIVMMALQKCISTCKFPPSISEVKKKISDIHWEAAEMLGEDSQTSSDLKQQAEWIYKQTNGYRYSIPQEPTVSQMISGSENMKLLGN
jgi:hypothetical protein